MYLYILLLKPLRTKNYGQVILYEYSIKRRYPAFPATPYVRKGSFQPIIFNNQ